MVNLHPQEHQLQPSAFSIPKELIPLVKELGELYNSHTQSAIIQSLQELIFNLKQSHSQSLTQAIAANSQTENEGLNMTSWEDLLNFTVYVDAEIYSYHELETQEPEPRSPAELGVITHQEATDAYIKSWSDIAEQMTELPDDIFTRFWTTAEVAKMLDCSAQALRKAKSQNRLPFKVNNFLVDCVEPNQRKLQWSIRLK